MENIKRIPFSFDCGEFEFNKMYLSVLGLFLPNKLTEKEIEILARFLAIAEKTKIDEEFNTYSRKTVKEELKISSAGLHNHLKSIMEKGYIEMNENGKLVVKSFLKPTAKNILFDIKINRK